MEKDMIVDRATSYGLSIPPSLDVSSPWSHSSLPSFHSSTHFSPLTVGSDGLTIESSSSPLNLLPTPCIRSTSIGAMQSPVTPTQTTYTAFTHSTNFFSHSGSASSMMDITSGNNQSSEASSVTSSIPTLSNDTGELESSLDTSDDDIDEDDGTPIEEVDSEMPTIVHSQQPPRPSSSPAINDPFASDSDDASYNDEEAEDDDNDDPTGDSSDMESQGDGEGNSLIDWVQQSRASGIPPITVLTRLLTDYSQHLTSKLLWNTAMNWSVQIQQQMVRESARRRKLSHVNTLDDVVSLIERSSKIVVLTGAGISVSAGIPDFRSKAGIYPRLKREFGMESPESMFDLDYFRANPQVFFTFAKELWPGSHHPTVAHRFIAKLEKEGKLLRNYTQNIDNLDRRAGIKNVLQCHGSFETAKCMTCDYVVHGMEIHKEIMNQRVAKCPKCWPADIPIESLEDVDENGLDRHCKTFGVIKPQIVFFGESLPESFRSSLEADRSVADLVIVMGSSLKVQPVAGMLEIFDKDTPMVLINREVVGQPDEFDVELLGLADDVCGYLANKLNWELPQVDPDWDSWTEPRHGSSTNAAAGNESASSSSSLPPVAVPCPPSPTFVAPNRYQFNDAIISPASSPISLPAVEKSSLIIANGTIDESDHANENSVDPKEDPFSLTSPRLDHSSLQTPQLSSIDIGRAASDMSQPNGHVTPISTLSPHSRDISSPARSPRSLQSSLTPLHIGDDSISMPPAMTSSATDNLDIHLVCTPTKASKCLPVISPHSHAQPIATDLPSSADTVTLSPSFTPRSRTHSPPITPHSLLSSTSLFTPSNSSSQCGKRRVDSLDSPMMQLLSSSSVTPTHKGGPLEKSSASVDSTVHTPAIISQMSKRRKISVPEEKQCDRPFQPEDENTQPQQQLLHTSSNDPMHHDNCITNKQPIPMASHSHSSSSNSISPQSAPIYEPMHMK